MNCKEIINSKFPVDAELVCNIAYMTTAVQWQIQNTFQVRYPCGVENAKI